MSKSPAPVRDSYRSRFLVHKSAGQPHLHRKFLYAGMALLAFVTLLALLTPLLHAEGAPSISTVDPLSGKVNDIITVTGQNLGKGNVSAVFLSDDKSDYKAVVVEQHDDKIVIKVPQVKPGSYNVSIQQGPNIYIQPVRFSVQE
jgi:IPT/TIG domain